MWNLSVGGWRMDTDLPLTPGTHLKLFVMLPDGAPPIVVDQAVVCWRRGPDVGLLTRHMAAPQATRLTEFIAARMTALV